MWRIVVLLVLPGLVLGSFKDLVSQTGKRVLLLDAADVTSHSHVRYRRMADNTTETGSAGGTTPAATLQSTSTGPPIALADLGSTTTMQAATTNAPFSTATPTPSTPAPTTPAPSTPAPSTQTPSSTPLPNAAAVQSTTLAVSSTESPASTTQASVTTPPEAGSTRGPQSSTTAPPPTPTTPRPTVSYKQDDHRFYTVHYHPSGDEFSQWWIDLDSLGKVTHKRLSNAHRLAVKVDLNFDFIYYGETLKSIVVATGGFLYTSELLHSLLSFTQYIAPLMANFNSSLGVDSNISYAQNESVFVAQWENLILNDQPELGSFTFQTSLHKGDGRIVFAYEQVPVDVAMISNASHLTHLGLADAYYRYFGNIISIYEYHTVSLEKKYVRSRTAIEFIHLQTCNLIKTCGECTSSNLSAFDCIWCNKTNTCSTAFDRNRQEWVTNRCPTRRSMSHTCTYAQTNVSSTTQSQPVASICTQAEGQTCPPSQTAPQQANDDGSVGLAVALCLIALCLIGGIAFWVYYAYTHPSSRSGQCLIQNRPSQLARKVQFWKSSDRGEQYKVDVQPM